VIQLTRDEAPVLIRVTNYSTILLESTVASSTDASNQSTLEHTAFLADPRWSHETATETFASRTIPRALVLAFMLAVMVGEAATNALGAGPNPGPACAAEDLSAFDVIEERSEVIGTSTTQVLEAVRRFLQARNLCLSGQEDEGVALYESAINTALGFATPAVSAMPRITAAVAGK
jgi:hypothetical protein